jgi:hypothetical protein
MGCKVLRCFACRSDAAATHHKAEQWCAHPNSGTTVLVRFVIHRLKAMQSDAVCARELLLKTCRRKWPPQKTVKQLTIHTKRTLTLHAPKTPYFHLCRDAGENSAKHMASITDFRNSMANTSNRKTNRGLMV